MAISSVSRYTAASSAVSIPTSRSESSGGVSPSSASDRAVGPIFAAQPQVLESPVRVFFLKNFIRSPFLECVSSLEQQGSRGMFLDASPIDTIYEHNLWTERLVHHILAPGAKFHSSILYYNTKINPWYKEIQHASQQNTIYNNATLCLINKVILRLPTLDETFSHHSRFYAPAWERNLDAPGKRACETPSVLMRPLERSFKVPTQEHGNQRSTKVIYLKLWLVSPKVGSRKLKALEIKSGTTIRDDFFKNLLRFQKFSGIPRENCYLIYGGATTVPRKNGNVCGWRTFFKDCFCW